MTDKHLTQPFADAAFDFEGLRRALHLLHAQALPEILLRCAAQAAAEHTRGHRAVVFMHHGGRLVARADSSGGDNSLALDIAKAVMRSAHVETRQSADQALLVAVPLSSEGMVRGVLVVEGIPPGGPASLAQVTWGLGLLADQTVLALDHQTVRTDVRTMQSTMLAADRDSYNLQIAGGFAHEMRNALTPAALMLQTVAGGPDIEPAEVLVDQDQRDVHALREVLSKPDVTPDDVAEALRLVTSLQERRAVTASALGIVGQALERGLRVSTQVVDFAQVGHLKPGDETVSIASVVAGVMDEYRDKLDAQAISAEINVEDDLMVSVKEAHIYAIIRNLVHNACDALGTAGVEDRRLHVEATRDASGIMLQVHDSGPGIPEDVRKRLFEPFFSTKGAKGTGLGLGLSRRLAQAYGGSLDFRRDARQGTTFWLRIPQNS